MFKDGNRRDDEVKQIRLILKDLESKTCELENKQFETNTDIEAFKMNMQMSLRGISGLGERVSELEDHDESHDERIAKLEKEMKEVTDKMMFMKSGNDDAPDADVLQKLLESLRKECDEKYSTKDDMEDLKKRLEKCEVLLEEHQSDIDALKRRPMISAGEGGEKIIIQQSSSEPALSKEDYDKLNLVSELAKRLEIVENELKDLNLGTLKDIIKDLQEKCVNLQDSKADKSDLGAILEQLSNLRDQIKEIEKDISSLKESAGAPATGGDTHSETIREILMRLEKIERKMEGMDKKMSTLARSNTNQTVTNLESPHGALEERLSSLEEKFEHHITDYEQFKKEVIAMLKELQDQMNNKVDYDRLKELEDRILNHLEERLRQLVKQLADKSETKKNLKMLEKQLKNLLDVFMQKQNNPDEENAMFSKKPLGGFSCASCEKNLINLQNKPPEYFNWNRFPMRDPAERIAKLGQGFSRMLSSMKPENQPRFQGSSVKQPNQFYDDGHVQDPNGPRTMQNFYHP